MKFSRWTFALIALNAGWLAVASFFMARHFRAVSENTVEYITNYVPVADAVLVPSVTNETSVTNAFRWAQLESEDYRTYIQRLRAIGCPEQTIRDIIVADVDKLLAPRVQAARLQPADPKYWEPVDPGSMDEPAVRDALVKQRMIDFEKREVVRELLGIDLVGERLKMQGQDDYHGARLQFLPDEKRAEVRLVLDEFGDKERLLLEQQIEEGAAFTGAADLKRLQQEKSAALSQLLTPQQREQFDLWFSQAATQTRDSVYGMNASEDEFLKIYNLRRQFEPQQPDGTLSRDAAQQLDSRVRQVLGEQRYADFARAQDAEFRDIFAVTSRFQLPQRTAVELYGYKQAASEQQGKVSADSNLTPAQKQAAQQAIAEEIQRAFRESLGEKAFRVYSRRIGNRF